MVGVRVGEATNPGVAGPADEKLLDCLQRDLSRVPLKVRRRIMDSDSDVSLLREDPSEAQRARFGHTASQSRIGGVQQPRAVHRTRKGGIATTSVNRAGIQWHGESDLENVTAFVPRDRGTDSRYFPPGALKLMCHQMMSR